MLLSAMSRTAFSSIRQKCTCSIIRANISRCGARSISLGPFRAGRSSCRPAPRNRAGNSRQKPPKRYSPRRAILPACFVVVGDTLEQAQAKRGKLDSLVNYANAIASLSIALGHDASKFDPDQPLPDDIPESNASKSGRERAIALGRRENLTVRQLAQRLGGYSGLAMVGTANTIADAMQEWLETEASDGFTVMFPYLPGGLDDFVEQVVPELQRRGLFRRDYEGVTLREHLGLPRPRNRFFEN